GMGGWRLCGNGHAPGAMRSPQRPWGAGDHGTRDEPARSCLLPSRVSLIGTRSGLLHLFCERKQPRAYMARDSLKPLIADRLPGDAAHVRDFVAHDEIRGGLVP